ncbi:MAG: HD domain-containing protein [Bacilli bacterium]|nr:HD domain-containing protein [Bacilli bacterium]
MNNNDIDKEFEGIIKPIIDNKEFRKLKSVAHHGISRFDHSLRVAYFSYKISKILHLNYKETTEAALLHDFFVDEVEEENSLMKLRRHPNHAVNNASKYFDLTDRQKDIIKTHMFPITFTPPKYIESWIVDIVDDFSAIYEKYYSLKKEMRAATSFMLILLVNIIRMR